VGVRPESACGHQVQRACEQLPSPVAGEGIFVDLDTASTETLRAADRLKWIYPHRAVVASGQRLHRLLHLGHVHSVSFRRDELA